MSLHSWFLWTKAKHRGTQEEGAIISTRLKELLEISKPDPVDKTFSPMKDEGVQEQENRETFGNAADWAEQRRTDESIRHDRSQLLGGRFIIFGKTSF